MAIPTRRWPGRAVARPATLSQAGISSGAAAGSIRSRLRSWAEASQSGDSEDRHSDSDQSLVWQQWAQLIRRIYESDPLLCTCGAQIRLVSFSTEPPVIKKILEHVERTGSEAARAPPRLEADPEALS